MADRGEKRKRVHLTIKDKLELLKKLDSGYSVAKVCDEYGVKKQTVSDIRKSRDKLQAFSLKFDVDSGKGKGKGKSSACEQKRKHMKVCSSKELEEAVYKWYVQQRSVSVNVRGIDILSAATKLAQHMGIPFSGSTGWLWRFRNRHGIGNKKTQGEAASADNDAVEPFRKKLKEVIREHDLHLNQVYNADETALFWRSLPVNTQAFKDEDKVPGKKLSKEKFSALLGANATGTHRLRAVVVGKAAKPRCLKDIMHELPVVYYHTKNSWFNAAIFKDWFFNHFIPEVRRYQETNLHIAPEDVKAILLLDNAPAHPHSDKLVSEDGRIRVVFLPPNTTSLIQPMDQGIIMATKRLYTRKYVDEVLVVIPEEEDVDADSRGLRTLDSVKRYNLKSAIFNFAGAWKKIKISTLANCWKKLLHDDDDPDLDFEGFEAQDFHRVFQLCGETGVSIDDVEQWLDGTDADPGHEMLSIGEIADQVTEQDDSSSSESEEEETEKPRMAEIRESIDKLLVYVDSSIASLEAKGYYQHLRALREIIIRDQYKSLTQTRIDTFLKPSSSTSSTPPPSSSPPPSPTPSTSFAGFE